MIFPEHPPKFKPKDGPNSDAIETTLSEEELSDYLNKNELPEDEDTRYDYIFSWYKHFRDQGYRDEYVEYQIRLIEHREN